MPHPTSLSTQLLVIPVTVQKEPGTLHEECPALYFKAQSTSAGLFSTPLATQQVADQRRYIGNLDFAIHVAVSSINVDSRCVTAE